MRRLTAPTAFLTAGAVLLAALALSQPVRASSPLDGSEPYVHAFAGAEIGRGLRLNNPFRLRTELGDSAESLSLTATYGLLHAGAALGDPDGFQHGVDARMSVALDGVRQEVFAPSYIALYPIPRRILVYGRLGAPIVLEPDVNVGAELALGGAVLVTGGIGVAGELAYSAFYGAGTWERAASFVPLISFEAGVWFDLELLP